MLNGFVYIKYIFCHMIFFRKMITVITSVPVFLARYPITEQYLAWKNYLVKMHDSFCF